MRTKMLRLGSLFALMLMLTAATSPSQTNVKNNLKPATTAPANAGTRSQCFIENNTFQDGEEFTFKLYYNWKFVWMSAGEVTFRVKDLGDQYHLSAHGSTYKSYDAFFKVRDKYDTWVDKETLLPKVSIRDVEEGPYRLYDKVTYDRNKGVAKSHRGKTIDVAKTEKYSVNNCVHDILSIIYFTRNLDFNHMQEGEKFPIDIFMDKKTWPLNVQYKGKDKKRVRGLGRFESIVFSPEVITGYVFDEGTEMNVWVSDDKNRIPLLIESPLTVGSVKAVLKDYKGLKYDLSSEL